MTKTVGAQNSKFLEISPLQSFIYLRPDTNGDGGTQSVTNLFRGYAKEYNNDLGVRKYHKVENPWSKQ